MKSHPNLTHPYDSLIVSRIHDHTRSQPHLLTPSVSPESVCTITLMAVHFLLLYTLYL
jgi:hypothetical protein